MNIGPEINYFLVRALNPIQEHSTIVQDNQLVIMLARVVNGKDTIGPHPPFSRYS